MIVIANDMAAEHLAVPKALNKKRCLPVFSMLHCLKAMTNSARNYVLNLNDQVLTGNLKWKKRASLLV